MPSFSFLLADDLSGNGMLFHTLLDQRADNLLGQGKLCLPVPNQSLFRVYYALLSPASEQMTFQAKVCFAISGQFEDYLPGQGILCPNCISHWSDYFLGQGMLCHHVSGEWHSSPSRLVQIPDCPRHSRQTNTNQTQQNSCHVTGNLVSLHPGYTIQDNWDFLVTRF